MLRIYRLVVAWCVAILGGFFSVAGGVLALNRAGFAGGR